MIQQLKWVERKFNFDFPSGIYPCLLERLFGTPLRMEEMTKGLSEEILILKPDGKWSIKEQIGHLIDLEELHEGRVDDFIAGKEMLRAADMANKKTMEANHNSRSLENLLHEFSEQRNHFIVKLRQADEDLINRVSIHPRLKIPMRLVDMVYFTCEHDDHHLAKIRWNMHELP